MHELAFRGWHVDEAPLKLRFKRLDRQTMVVMGASSGIGLLLARRAAKAGTKVFLIARDRRQLEAISTEINDAGGQSAFATADVGVESEVQAAAWAAIARFGGIDTWVNTAGVALYAPLLETTAADHERVFKTNYWGVVHGSLAGVEHLRRHGGALITIGSVVCDIGTPILGAYAASKHAVKGFIDSLRIELLADDVPISVTLIKPCGIGTPLAEHAGNRHRTAGRIPPPAYEPDLVVDAILHSATHARREFTVGGVGALQILGSVLLPGTSDWIASKIRPLLTDRHRPAPAVDNLYEPVGNGQERSVFEPMRRTSVYTAAVLNPWFAALTVASIAIFSVALLPAARKRR